MEILFEPVLYSLPVEFSNSHLDTKSDALVNFVREHLSSVVGIVQDSKCGRRVIAARNLTSGEIVLQEKSPIFTVSYSKPNIACHHCGHILDTDTKDKPAEEMPEKW
jgi:hypothetical protein